MQLAGILARDIHGEAPFKKTVEEENADPRKLSLWQIPVALKQGPPPKGVIRYGLQVNLRNCAAMSSMLKAIPFVAPSPEGVAVDIDPSLRDIRGLTLAATPDGFRSKTTKESLGYIAYELSRLRNDMSADEMRASDAEDLLARRARKCWFSEYSFDTEWVLLPASGKLDSDPESPSLGDIIYFGDRVVLCQASTFGGPRYALGTCHSRDLGYPESYSERRQSPILRRLDGGSEEDRPVFSEWFIVDATDPTSTGLVTLHKTVLLKSTEDEYLTLKLDSREDLDILMNIVVNQELLQIPNYSWVVTPVQSDGLQKISWGNHYLADATIPLPMECFHHSWFESNITFTPESRAIIAADGPVDLGIQELLLVEDVLSTFFGVLGEFIELLTEFPDLSAYDVNQNAPKPTPQFGHRYHTFVQTEDPETYERRYRPVKDYDENARDVSNIYDSVAAIDESLRAMTDKIMTTVHAVSMIRHVAEIHMSKPTTRTNEALGAALKFVLKELESKVAHLEGFYSDSPLSLQRLWSLIHPAKPSLTVLSLVATSTYGVEGLELLNILQNLRTGDCPNESLKSMLSFLILATSQPLVVMLNKWVYGGVLDDPCGEFFITSNPRLQRPVTQISKWLYWEHKFAFIDSQVPRVIAGSAQEIYEIGKAWRVIEDYYNGQQSEGYRKVEANCRIEALSLDDPQLSAIVKRVHSHVFAALKEILVQKENIFDMLKTFQSVFFHAQSDYVADLFELATNEMESSEPHLDTLERMFRRALGTSVLHANPYTKYIRLSSSLVPMATMSRWADSSWNGCGDAVGPSGSLEDGQVSDIRSFSAPKARQAISISYPNMNSFVRAAGITLQDEADAALIDALDTFTDLNDSNLTAKTGKLNNHALGVMCDIPVGPLDASHFITPIVDLPWPLHLVIDTHAMISYQNVFRTLLMLKYIQLRLHGTWKSLCQLERLKIASRDVDNMKLLPYCLQIRQMMSQFYTNLMAYLTEEVLDPAFHQFIASATKSATYFDLLEAHKRFLHRISYECLLTRSDLYRKLVYIVEVSKMFVKFTDEFLYVKCGSIRYLRPLQSYPRPSRCWQSEPCYDGGPVRHRQREQSSAG
eukprot:Blabericola_migrator_1__146@NODE_1039_length_5629_cov_110_027508_g715_i0_p1_GENE_NODE_1039_length_5629_cov_110_027508_g715_i0NODE_1039_length_5629_cov_110_027508_g715_i0_p1_ORF_typecomplete_len1100_score164_11GCP_N_terminal/PF17681_1/3_5e40GCP_N_terminal/PF17681_1/4_8e03GCP_C_terminal/PF04130_13/1_5e37_NODE_1039_length_5629_cov_110_027508_g715_i05883887